ncbi:hypothetical protein GF373_01370 [bacterium]|nr:hypothetical protein [bacterium]
MPIQTRREFKKTMAGLSMLSVLPGSARSANDAIHVGVIGCGDRARNALMKRVFAVSGSCHAVITAVCDVWRQHREEAAAMVEEHYAQKPAQYVDYKDLLREKEIDAVIIATPEHQHTTMLQDAIAAGKDVYIEKPLAMQIEELNEAVDAVKASERVVQVGTQLRSYPSFTGCKKVVQEGQLGNVHKIMQVRNSYRPYWHRYKRPIKQSDTDWGKFLMHRPDRPFSADQHSAWYGYREFSLGPIASLMAHFIDLVHYITGEPFPHSAVALAGNYVWEDRYTVPDSVHALLEYRDKFMVSYCTSYGNGGGNYMRFLGTKGTIDATNWRKPILSGEGSEAEDRIRETSQVPDVSMPQHMEDWLQCIRTRKQPNADIHAGEQHAVACILANEALIHNRRMVYDRDRRRIEPA